MNYYLCRYISQTQGLPAEHMLNSASKTTKFFYRDVDAPYPFWRLKTPEEHEAETGNKSKEARKYIFNCLDDIGQVNVPTDLENGQLLAEKTDRREFIDLLKCMLTIDQERRITPGEALNHPFTTLAHLVNYAHCNNVKASVQMMEVCRRDSMVHSAQPTTATLVTNFVPNAENMTFAINNQLSSQVQRLVRERGPTTYDNLYQFYGGRNVGRQYANDRNATFQHQLVSSLLCPPSYQAMPSPTKHVVVGGAVMQPPLQVPPQQYVNVPVPVSMVEPTSGQRMLLTNAVQSTVAWPQGGRQLIVPTWTQQAAPHSLIVDSTPFLNVEEIYPKQHLNIPRHELKKESPMHHLIVPRHEKKETNQLSPVKKRVKENTPPHQRYNRQHISPQYHHSQGMSSSSSSSQNFYQPSHHQASHHYQLDNSIPPQHHHSTNSLHSSSSSSHHHHHHYSNNNNSSSSGATSGANSSHGTSNTSGGHQHHVIKHPATITIHDTPSPTQVITISDSEDDEPPPPQQQQLQQQTQTQVASSSNHSNNNASGKHHSNRSTQASSNSGTGSSTTTSSSSQTYHCRGSQANPANAPPNPHIPGPTFAQVTAAPHNRSSDHHQHHSSSSSSVHHHSTGTQVTKSSSSSNLSNTTSSNRHHNPSSSITSSGESQRHRKNVISCVTVADSDGEERRSPKPTGVFLTCVLVIFFNVFIFKRFLFLIFLQ